MIKRGHEVRVGPLRVLVLANIEGRCEVMTFYKDKACVGKWSAIEEATLLELQAEADLLQ